MARQVVAETLLEDGRTLTIDLADATSAPIMCEVIIDAFAHRAPVSPAPAALSETPESVATGLSAGFGLLALVDGEPAGVVLLRVDGAVAGIRRVSVRPQFQQLGIAAAMVGVAGDLLAARGVAEVRLIARAEFPELVSWWRRHGFTEYGRNASDIHLRHAIAVRALAPTAADMHALGVRLAGLLKPGDVLIAAGELGAGKTTLAQGIGAGLGVTGPVVSPTFVLSRVHPSASGGPAFVHVDAYRLGSFAELEDIDVETGLDASVTYVEWGEGLAEGLADDRLEIGIRRTRDPQDDTRWVFLMPIGPRWEAARVELAGLGESGRDEGETPPVALANPKEPRAGDLAQDDRKVAS